MMRVYWLVLPRSLIVGLLLTVVSLQQCPVWGHQGDLRLVDNGYEGLVVAISEDLPHQHCNQILHGIKNVLREFSQQLLIATGGRASLRSVTVSLPKSWRTDTLTCSLTGPLTIISSPVTQHIRVAHAHPVYGARPWLQQSQGCGRPGDFIQLGDEMLRVTSNDSYAEAAKQLLKQWVKFRWGVFDEYGYKNDVLYPATYRDPGSGVSRNNDCRRRGSEMPFCDASDHIPEAPTKHNAMCRGRSVWNIIEQSQDFRNYRNPPINSTAALVPTLKFVQPGSPRVVLVVEDTAVMNLQRRWEFVRKAVRRVVVYDMPDDAYIGVVVFNSVARTTASLAKMDQISDVRQRIGSSMPRNPSHIPERHKCLLCGLQEALRALATDEDQSEGATLVFLTTGSGTTSQEDMDEMVKLAVEKKVQVEVILYPLTEHRGSASLTHGLEELVAATHGDVFTVIDEGVGNDSKMSMMVSLMDALLAAVRRSSSPSGAPVLVHSQSYPGGIASVAEGTFELDDSLGPNARFSVYYYDLNHVGNTIQLTTPSGRIMSSINTQEEDGDANVIFMNLPRAERGLWKYEVENRADSHQGLHIQVTAQESGVKQMSLRVWTSNSRGTINGSDPSAAVIVYAEVMDGSLPVLNARVVATIRRLGTNATGSNYQPHHIELLDNGLGDPDLTSGDGIYSRYIPYYAQLHGQPGYYELSVTADHNHGLAVTPVINIHSKNTAIGINGEELCCGSTVKYESLTAASPFQRSEIYGVLEYISQVNKDIVPPNRILDLRASVNISNFEVTLRWTAPGDDNDWGRVNFYEACLASTWTEAKAYAGAMVTGMPPPVIFGTEQTISFYVDRYDQNIYVAIRGVDEAGNKGGVSNIVTVWIPHPPTTTPVPTIIWTTDHPNRLMEPRGQEITQPIRVSGFSVEDMAIIVGAVTGFLIIIIMIVIFCFFHVARRKRNGYKRDQEKVEANNQLKKTNSSLIIDKNETQESVDSIIKEDKLQSKNEAPLSPMPSWSASKLLQEHEQRFSVAGGHLEEASEALAKYQNMQDSFPDVTLINTSQAYPASQTPSTTHSDPPAYQLSYSAYPYSYQPSFSHEDLPPYTPQGLSSQSSQASTIAVSQASEGPYPHEVAFSGELMNYSHPPQPVPVYIPGITDIDNIGQSILPQGKKVAPPVAPKPPQVTRNLVETKRRNVTQV
ncbi:unnamed protein product [Meganyctiphanes norvegica]|uniref:VWFA domain-containing protein n=1 Tax=Meganyctiphanes norvegica TaxID=48144 RepID=A0AAV2R449_MEGNR